jgi:8-oxo-dGTP diphosphatase
MQKIPTMLTVVAAALQNPKGQFLLQKRPEGRAMAGLWEFPGGKIDGDETPEQALVRELSEELAIHVDSENLAPACFASAPLGDRQLLLLLYRCRIWEGVPTAVESPALGWFEISEMRELAMPPADEPLLDLLERLIV